MDRPIDIATPRRMDRIVHKADFERVLAARSSSRSAHFALHHLGEAPLPRVWVAKSAPVDVGSTELSTGRPRVCPQPVDNTLAVAPKDLWFGCVVPKRHAKRAVTRNLLKRQIRSAFGRLGAGLPAGLWLVRLKAPFGAKEFISAKSELLAVTARKELETLLTRAAA